MSDIQLNAKLTTIKSKVDKDGNIKLVIQFEAEYSQNALRLLPRTGALVYVMVEGSQPSLTNFSEVQQVDLALAQ